MSRPTPPMFDGSRWPEASPRLLEADAEFGLQVIQQYLKVERVRQSVNLLGRDFTIYSVTRATDARPLSFEVRGDDCLFVLTIWWNRVSIQHFRAKGSMRALKSVGIAVTERELVSGLETILNTLR